MKGLQEKDKNQHVTMQEVENLSKKQRYALLKRYPVDVVHHFDARFRTLLQAL